MAKYPVTVSTAAREAGVHSSTVYRWIDEGRIETTEDQQDHGYVLIPYDEIETIRREKQAKGERPVPGNPGKTRAKPGPKKGTKKPIGGAYGPAWMTIPQAAKVLDISTSRLYDHIRKKKFPEDPEHNLDWSPKGDRMVRKDQVHRYADHLIVKHDGGPLPVGRQGRPDLESWPSVLERRKNRHGGARGA